MFLIEKVSSPLCATSVCFVAHCFDISELHCVVDLLGHSFVSLTCSFGLRASSLFMLGQNFKKLFSNGLIQAVL
jgi:hypothetical protein